MLRKVGRRLLTAAATLLLVTLLVFVLIQTAPGSPLEGDDFGLRRLSPDAMEQLETQYRLDRPLHVQYGLWLADVARGDLGESFYDRRPVARKIGERLPVTLQLNALALIVMIGVAVPLGAAAALRPGSAWDRRSALATFLLYAIPSFWAGLLLQLLFAVGLDWLPLYGLTSDHHQRLGWVARLFDRLAHLVLPVTCLSYAGLAYLSRFVRATLIDSGSAEIGLAARARGLSAWSVLVRHGFRQAAIPMLTLAGFLLPGLIAGSVVVETLFELPGLGNLFFDAALNRDMPVLLALTLLSGAITLLGVLLADLAYAIADPRVRRG